MATPAAQMPLPVKPKMAPPPMPVPADAGLAAAEQTPLPAVRIPALENAPMVEDSGVSLLPNGPLRAEDENVQINHAPPARLNGAGHAKTRSAGCGERGPWAAPAATAAAQGFAVRFACGQKHSAARPSLQQLQPCTLSRHLLRPRRRRSKWRRRWQFRNRLPPCRRRRQRPYRSSNRGSSKGWPTRYIRMARSRPSCRAVRFASGRSPSCAITSNRTADDLCRRVRVEVAGRCTLARGCLVVEQGR